MPELTYVKGEPLNLEEEIKKGNKVFVFEFWATWCPPCRNSIPHVTELQKKYENRDVVFIGITDESQSQIQPFVQQMGSKMDYRVAVDHAGWAQRNYMGKYHISSIPHAFVVGKDGQVVWHGHPMDGALESSIESAINYFNPSKYDNMSREELAELPVKVLKQVLQAKKIDYSGCVEKSEMLALL